jgi:hypothetical protein
MSQKLSKRIRLFVCALDALPCVLLRAVMLCLVGSSLAFRFS